jgi:hypothetical protein
MPSVPERGALSLPSEAWEGAASLYRRRAAIHTCSVSPERPDNACHSRGHSASPAPAPPWGCYVLVALEPRDPEDRPGGSERARVGRSEGALSRAEQSPWGYGMRGCWRVPMATSGRLARSHLAVHIELHLCSGDGQLPRSGIGGRPTDAVDRGLHGKVWGTRRTVPGNLGYYPTIMQVLRSAAWCCIEPGGRGDGGEARTSLPSRKSQLPCCGGSSPCRSTANGPPHG